MAERSNAAVLKTVVRATGPGVRIPLSPPKEFQTQSKPRKLQCLRGFPTHAGETRRPRTLDLRRRGAGFRNSAGVDLL